MDPMWMAELAARSGLSVATIKYYLREGLLHHGQATGATRTRYDESHVRRLRLIRSLTEVAGLRLDTVGQILEDIESADSWHEAVGSAHVRLATADSAPATEESRRRVDDFLERQRWSLGEDSPQRELLARSLDALAGLDHPLSNELLDLYAEAMRPVAAHEVAAVRSPDREASAEAAVVGTLLQEPVLLAVRRIAQENASREQRD
ncbi:DNA-binding transcriptional MerR regulator [Marmoricola sp. URHA0025 HA25]